MIEIKEIYKRDTRLNSPQGVNRLMQRVINMLLKGDIEKDIAHEIGYLCNILYKGLSIGDLEQRITELEQIKKGA